jgi:hypothetical protein
LDILGRSTNGMELLLTWAGREGGILGGLVDNTDSVFKSPRTRSCGTQSCITLPLYISPKFIGTNQK